MMLPVAMFRHAPEVGTPDQLYPRCKGCEGIATRMDVIAQHVNRADTQSKVGTILDTAIEQMGGVEGFAAQLTSTYLDVKATAKSKIDIAKLIVKMAEFADKNNKPEPLDLSRLSQDELEERAQMILQQRLIASATPATTEPVNEPDTPDAKPPSTAAE